MLSFEIAGGTGGGWGPASRGLELFSIAGSLGGVESLVAHPASMTHAAMDAEARARAGIADSLLRISAGIEALEDLRADLARGLERVRRARAARRRSAAPSSGRLSTAAPASLVLLRRALGAAMSAVRAPAPWRRYRRLDRAAPPLEPERVAQQHGDAQDAPKGLAMPVPAMSGAEPWIGS